MSSQNPTAAVANDTAAHYRDIIERYRRALPAGTTSHFRIDKLDYVGMPVASVTHISEDGTSHYGVGYGATEEEALVGGFGELVEEVHLDKSFQELRLEDGSFRDMQNRHGAEHVVDPLTLVLPAGSLYTPELPLRWAPINRLRDDAPCWIPAEFVSIFASRVQYPNKLITSITNGDGAGDTRTRSLLHGTLELLQRDGNADSFRALDQGRVLDRRGFPADIVRMLDDLRAKGLEVIPKLARVTCGCVSVYAVGRDHTDDRFPLTLTACGEAADMNYHRALRKAILECAASHSRKLFYHSPFDRKRAITPPGYLDEQIASIRLEDEEDRAVRTLVGWMKMDKSELERKLENSVFRHRETVPVAGLPAFGSDDLEDRWQYLQDQIRQEGLEMYYFAAHTVRNDVSVTKSIVPGIEMEFGSYHRIGYRGVQRLLDRDDQLVSRQVGLGKKRILLPKDKEEALGGPFWLDVQKLDSIIAPLYPLYREPTGHSARYALESGWFDA